MCRATLCDMNDMVSPCLVLGDERAGGGVAMVYTFKIYIMAFGLFKGTVCSLFVGLQ